MLVHPCRAAPQAGGNAVTQHLPAPNRQRHGSAGIGGVVEHTQRLPCRTIAPLCRQEPAHQRLLQREKVQGIRRVGVGAGKLREPCPQRQQAAVVVHQRMVFFGPLPVQPVQRRRGAVAVALPFFGAGKLLARLQERQTEAGQVNARRQPVLGKGCAVCRRELLSYRTKSSLSHRVKLSWAET